MDYFGGIINFCLGFSLLGCLEALSVAFILFYVCTKTRASSVIGSLFPALGINYGRSIMSIGFDNVFSSLRNTSKDVNQRHNNAGHGAQNLLQITPHAGRKPYNAIYDWGIYLPHMAQNLRFKKYDFPQVSDLVLKDATLQRAIKQSSEEIFKERTAEDRENDETFISEDSENKLYQKILKSQNKRKIRILTDMKSKLSDILLRMTSWVLYKLLPCFLNGVVTHTKQVEMLKTASERSPGVPLIFLPLHRSHLDYIMVTYILVNYDIKAPLVAAGNNLQIPVFGRLLRGLGAFFIKRKIDPVIGKKDILYRAVLHLYLQHALKLGHNIEFFIEGGRTRTGKPCMPKNGILSVIVNAFMDGTIEDALLVPVSVNYEKLVDGNFIREQLGQKKKPESFRSAMSGIWKALTSNYGLMRIDFNEPFSIKELVSSYNRIAQEEGSTRVYQPGERRLQHIQSSSSLYGTDVVNEEHRTLVDSISRQVVYDCAATTSVMTTNAIAFLLLTRFRNGVAESILVEELDRLRDILKGRRDLGFSGNSLDIVKYACDLLGEDMVSRIENNEHIFIKPKIEIPNVIELAYYSNALTPHFALECIVVTTLCKLLEGHSNGSGVSRRRLIETCNDHCEILRYEFILSKPTQNLTYLIDETIDNLVSRDIIKSLESKNRTENDIHTDRIVTSIRMHDLDLDDDFDDDYQVEKAEIFLTDNKVELDALLSVLAPFAHSYLTVAESLDIIFKKELILETDFIKYVIKSITNKYEGGNLRYGESISTESVKNCLKLFEKMSIIKIISKSNLRLLTLADCYNSMDNIQNVIDQIHAIVPNQK